MFIWTDESIAWYVRAAEFHSFFHEIAEILRRFIGEGESVCEVGSGPGYLSLALAPHVKDITAVDIEKKVLDILEANKKRLRIPNITCVRADWNDLKADGGWDTIIASNFGDMPGDMEHFMRLCKKQVVYIHRKCGEFPERADNTRALRAYLEEGGYRYEFLRRNIRFGQHFKSLWEAERFFAHYRQLPETGKEAFLAERLVKSDEEEYPLYYPGDAATEVYVIQKPGALNSPGEINR
jgi:ubiquinone/menaquinone biosynthesis C-methylase UbiE